MKYITITTIPVLLSLLFFSCNNFFNISNANLQEMDMIRFVFQDSSVPPPYHRSYTIRITHSEVHCKVTSYQDVLADKTYPFTKEQFDILKEKTDMLQRGGTKVTDASGTEHYGIFLEKGDETFYRLYWDNLKKHKINDSTLEYMELLKATVPDLKELIKVG